MAEWEHRYGYAAPDRYEILRGFARENKAHMTVAECCLWNELRDKGVGVPFRRQCIIGDYIADFACLSRKLIVEIDGGYHSEPQQHADDVQRTQALQRLGFRVVRFTNEEVLEHTEQVIKKIQQYL